VATRYHDLRDREDGRPPRDWASWEKRNRDADRNPFFSGIQDYSRTAGTSWKFRDLGDDVRKDVGRMSHDLDAYRQQRIKAEAAAAARANEAGREPDRVRVLKPPIGDVNRAGPNRVDPQGRTLDADRPRIDDRRLDDRRNDRDRPKPDKDNPGPLNEIRDVPKDRPKSAPPVDRDDRPPTPRPNRDIPQVEPRDRTPETPKVTPRVNPPIPRETPKPPPREVPKETPKTTPQPRPQPAPQPMPKPAPRVERPDRPAPGTPGKGAGGGGRPQGGGERPDRGKKN
jgi:hypothetical protein